MIAHASGRPAGRRISGFSLDEASSLRSMVIAHADHVSCPSCGCPINPTVGGAREERVYLLRCPCCRRGLVIEVSPRTGR